MKTNNDSNITADAGKTNATLRLITENPTAFTQTTKARGAIVYVSTREEVERLDVSRFIANFSPRLPRTELRQLRGRIVFTVDGYDDTSDQLFEIPEVRAYYAYVHRVWPSWLFTACLSSPCLRVIALSVLQNVSIIRARSVCRIQISEFDLHTFFLHSLPAAALLHQRAGISKQNGTKHLKAVANYLGIPEE